MSPSMKSKSMSKDKASARAGKEQQKASPKTTNHGSGIPASAYNPILGTFHTLETSFTASSTPLHENSHFLKIDDTDEHSSTSPQGTVSEYDSVSNNGSCSGESEDHKEKSANASSRLDIIPGCDNDRREKIRLKNERKHQRQRERRAQQLHDRCCGYLMSRKLESLAQQLMAMGFSSERATLALMLNDGKLEQSVSWLFEGSEEESHTKDATKNLVSEGNMKIDISEELCHISAMEVRYNCSKQEVERVVVACEGDLHKAEHTLQSQKETKLEEDSTAQNNTLMRSSQASVSLQQRGNESEFHSLFQDHESRNLLHLNHHHPNEPAEKRWCVNGSSSHSTMLAAPSMQVLHPFEKSEARLNAEGKLIQQVVGRESAVMAQRLQFTNGKPNSVMSSLDALPAAGWYAASSSNAAFENVRSNVQLLQNHNRGSVQSPYNEYSYALGLVGDSNSSSARLRGFYKPMIASSPSPSPPPHSSIPSQRSWNMTASSSSLTFPPALGLFSAHQNAARTYNSQHSRVDWNTGGLMPEFDYTSIDWTLDCPSSSSSSKAGGLWLGISSLLRNGTGLQNVGGMARESSSSSSAAGLKEWTSPFAGKDIFSVPRQFVTSPPL